MTQKRYLYDIDPGEWEHPLDRAALSAVKQLPMVNDIVRSFIGSTTERSLRSIALASSVRASERQFPGVYRLLIEAANILDVKELPELYVSQNPFLNAGAMGVEHPFITLNSSMLSVLSEEELLAVIGHELGHIASGHGLYKTLLWMLVNFASGVIQFPLGQAALMAIITALREWDRKSELSADRAGLLVVQDVNPSLNLLMKLAGGAQTGEMNLSELFVQADDYERGKDILDSVYKILNSIGSSHPFPIVRLKEIKNWHAGGEYERIMSGSYRKRGQGDRFDFSAEAERVKASYEEEMKRSHDPLFETMNRVGEVLKQAGDQAGKQMEEFFKNIFRGNS